MSEQQTWNSLIDSVVTVINLCWKLFNAIFLLKKYILLLIIFLTVYIKKKTKQTTKQKNVIIA